jgi:thiamine-monophosphate kinase
VVELGIGDDMAVLKSPDDQLLITTDLLLEGVHFDLTAATLEQVGYKAMACSLSDCAAMASLPLAAVVSVSLPQSMSMTDAHQLHTGLQKTAQQYNCPLVGGDTNSWPQSLTVNIAMLSRPAGITPVRRSTARPDDFIFVTGSLGGSLTGKHLTFTPRVHEARQLASNLQLHAMIDISDGLSQDLHHICIASNVSAILEPDTIPISLAAQTSPDPLHSTLTDGEDYELLFTLAPDQLPALTELQNQLDVPLTRIGRLIEPDKTPALFLQQKDQTLKPLIPKGYQHFHD